MLKIVTEGQVYGVEPISENAESLQRRYPNAIIFSAAASDCACETEFFHVLGRPARSGLRRLSYPDPNQKVKTITVKTDRLADLIPEGVNIDFIKIDVEGA